MSIGSGIAEVYRRREAAKTNYLSVKIRKHRCGRDLQTHTNGVPGISGLNHFVAAISVQIFCCLDTRSARSGKISILIGGNAKLTLAMTRHLGLFTQYSYYRYESAPQTELLFLAPLGVRHVVAVGVEAWLSLYDKDKVTRDTR